MAGYTFSGKNARARVPSSRYEQMPKHRSHKRARRRPVPMAVKSFQKYLDAEQRAKTLQQVYGDGAFNPPRVTRRKQNDRL